MSMTGCSGYFFQGHKWSKWRKSYANPEKRKDGRFYRTEFQRRRCARCGFTDTNWTGRTALVITTVEKGSKDD